jgi:hypothetical protein
MNNTVEINLTGEYAININTKYELSIQLANAYELSGYNGYCQIRNSDNVVVVTATIEVVNNDIFKIKIFPNMFTVGLEPGSYVYDVLFVGKTDPNNRFYPVGGKCQLVKRVSQVL